MNARGLTTVYKVNAGEQMADDSEECLVPLTRVTTFLSTIHRLTNSDVISSQVSGKQVSPALHHCHGPWVTMRFQLQLPVPGTLCHLSSEMNSPWWSFDSN